MPNAPRPASDDPAAGAPAPSLPCELHRRAAPVGGGVLAVVALVLLVAGGAVIVAAATTSLDAGPLLGGLALLLFGGWMLAGTHRHVLTARHLRLEREGVTVRETSLLGRRTRTEPLAAFRGVHLRRQRVSGRQGPGVTSWHVELSHPRANSTLELESVLLRDQPSEAAMRARRDAWAAALSMPIVDPPPPWWQRLSLYRRWLRADPWPFAWDPGVTHRALGRGSRQPFATYLQRDGAVAARSLDEVLDFLLTCRYLADRDGAGAADHWQHPCDFESARAGDCEDHALWAWRKLLELGQPVRFHVGLHALGDEVRRHAWVELERDGRRWVLEATSKTRERLLVPLDQARRDYCPQHSVGPDLRVRSHRGAVWRHLGWDWRRARSLRDER